jgi:hypothetical protein
MEMIEIGLVVIDLETLEIVDEFQRFVRPQIKPILTDLCKKLTSNERRQCRNLFGCWPGARNLYCAITGCCKRKL